MFECKLCGATDCDCDFDEVERCDNCGEVVVNGGVLCDICIIDEEDGEE